MTTLREILDERMKPCPCAAIIESWAFGQERECLDCGGNGYGTWSTGDFDHACPTCGGTGTIREPGLVERLDASLGRSRTPYHEQILGVLREELGME